MNSLGGIAIDGDGNMWADDNFLVGAQSTIFQNFGGGVSKIAPNGKPLSPETGFNFGGQLGLMQGIIATPNDDVWALDNQKDQIVCLPQGDGAERRILGRTVNGKPVDGTLQVKGPFHLAVDQQDRIGVTNGGSNTDALSGERSRQGRADQSRVRPSRAVAIDSLEARRRY